MQSTKLPSLYDWQEPACDWLLKHPHAGLWLTMGAGKTPITLEAISRLNLDSALVLCTKAIKETWAEQFLVWTKFKREDIFICYKMSDVIPASTKVIIANYDLIRSTVRKPKAKFKSKNQLFEQIYKRRYDIIVVDEAQKCKDIHSATANTVFGRRGYPLIAKGARQVVLSGTFTPNGPVELFPAWRAMHPESLEPYLQYNNYGYYFCGGYADEFGRDIFKGASHVPELKERLKKWVYFMPPDEVYKNMPGISYNDIVVDVEPMITPDNAPIATAYKALGTEKAKPVIAWLQDFVALYPGLKVLVFAHNVDTINAIKDTLGTKAVSIFGQTTDKEREIALMKFKTNVPILVAGITVLGEAVDGLQRVCNNVAFAQIDWVPGKEAQAIGRLRRSGQTKPVMVTRFVSKASVDKRVLMSQSRKNKFIDEVSEMRTDTTKENVMSIEETLVRIAVALESIASNGAVAEAPKQKETEKSQSKESGQKTSTEKSSSSNTTKGAAAKNAKAEEAEDEQEDEEEPLTPESLKALANKAVKALMDGGMKKEAAMTAVLEVNKSAGAKDGKALSVPKKNLEKARAGLQELIDGIDGDEVDV